MAISAIQADMEAGRYGDAKDKIDAFAQTWQRFSSGSDAGRGAGIGDIMVTFSTMAAQTNAPSDAPLNP
jgi:hypothetical protein